MPACLSANSNLCVKGSVCMSFHVCVRMSVRVHARVSVMSCIYKHTYTYMHTCWYMLNRYDAVCMCMLNCCSCLGDIIVVACVPACVRVCSHAVAGYASVGLNHISHLYRVPGATVEAGASGPRINGSDLRSPG